MQRYTDSIGLEGLKCFSFIIPGTVFSFLHFQECNWNMIPSSVGIIGRERRMVLHCWKKVQECMLTMVTMSLCHTCKIARNLASSDAQWQEKRRGSNKNTQAVHIPREPQASSYLRLRQLLWGEVAAGASLGAL